MLILESRTFLGLTPEWAGVIVGFLTLIAAAAGYWQLIKGAKDVQDQIIALNKTSRSMAALAKTTQESQHASRVLMMPWFKYEKHGYSYDQNREGLILTLKNVGPSSAMLIRMDRVPGDTIGHLEIKEHSIVKANENMEILWGGNPLVLKQGMIQVCIWYSDSHGARYVQRFTLIRDDQSSLDPQRTDLIEVLLPDYMREHKTPVLN